MIDFLNCVSLFSGIGGFDLGFERVGIPCTHQVEIDKACRSVLKRHFPNAELHEDVRHVGSKNLGYPDIIVGGFPCQDLSVAGKRTGLAGERSGLWFEFQRIIGETLPDWVVIENVPGLLSSNHGRDFAIVLGGLTGLIPEVPAKGWGNAGLARGPIYNVAYRILDAQYFGVAQRRRRVFIIGYLGEGRAAEVLFERESRSGDTAPSRKTWERTARNSGVGFSETGQGYWGGGIAALRAEGENRPSRPSSLIAYNINQHDDNRKTGMQVSITDHSAPLMTGNGKENTLIAFGGNNTSGAIDVATACNAHGGTGRMDFESETFVAFGLLGETTPKASKEVMPTLCSTSKNSGEQHQFVDSPFGVRRLTPTECERLQGFPDGWTADQSDSTRYRQLGNAVAVPCIEWIAGRILNQYIH